MWLSEERRLGSVLGPRPLSSLPGMMRVRERYRQNLPGKGCHFFSHPETSIDQRKVQELLRPGVPLS